MQKIEFKNLPDTSTPLSAENLNAIQTNTENAINQEVSTATKTTKNTQLAKKIEITDSANVCGKLIDLKGDTYQETRSGKNEFDGVTTYISRATFSNGVITMTANEGSTQTVVFSASSYEKNTQYTVSFDAISTVNETRITFDGQPDSATGSGRFPDQALFISKTKTRYSVTGSMTNDFTGLRFFRISTFEHYSDGTITISNIQIAKGTDTVYEKPRIST